MMKILHQMTTYDPDEYSIVFQDTSPVPYLHWHRELQVIWLQEGHGTAIIGNHIQTFKPDEIYIVGTNQPHFFRASNGDHRSIKMACLYIDHHQAFSNIRRHIPELESLIAFLKMADNGLQVPHQYVEVVGQYIRKMKDKKGFDRFFYFLELVRTLMDIDVRCAWQPLSSALGSYKVDVSDRLNLIYQYTMDHYMDEISLEEIASVACMTPNAFCSYFKKRTRITYFSFLNDLRISEACKKLRNGQYQTIAAVAYASGFANTITFNRVFRKAMDMTPSEYIELFKPFKPKEKAVAPFSAEVFY